MRGFKEKHILVAYKAKGKFLIKVLPCFCTCGFTYMLIVIMALPLYRS